MQLWDSPSHACYTGWPRPTGCLKLHVIFRNRATDCRALLQKITCKDKACYGSSPLCDSLPSRPSPSDTLQHPTTQSAWNSWEHTIKRCNSLQHAATRCYALQCTAMHCNTQQCAAMHCHVLQCTATHCNALQHTATHCNTFVNVVTISMLMMHTWAKCVCGSVCVCVCACACQRDRV